jgi:lambda family phage portal protein
MSVRRWDAAKTNRLNSAHWARVTGQTINLDLAAYLESLRTRCEYEAANNTDVEGVINTHTTDVIGAHGPILQVHSDSEGFNAWLEATWASWWAKPDLNGQLSGVDILDLEWWGLWTAGEILIQKVTDKDGTGPVKLRLLPIAPRRLATPTVSVGKPEIVLGIERNKTGKPINYHVDDTPENAYATTTNTKAIPAKDIIHLFRVVEAGQVRGVPWLTAGLQSIANLRDFDEEVMEAARGAAEHGIVLTATDTGTEFIEVNASTPMERGTVWTMPPGYQATQIHAEQPSSQYMEFVEEQQRRLGRGTCMPVMIARLDARKHNYSSARFDSQGYVRRNNKLRAWLERGVLNGLVDDVADEAGRGAPARPPVVTYKWIWETPAHVDQLKEEKACTERLNNGTSTLRDECDGDWEEIIEQRAREHAALLAAGLIPTPAAESEDDDLDEKVAEAVESAKE